MASLSANLENITNYLSADQQSQHGQKKDRFNFSEYYDRKKKIQLKLQSNAQRRNESHKKWLFTNCCSLTLGTNATKPNQIFNIIKTKLAQLNIKDIDITSIGQLGSSKSWQIQFKNEWSYELAPGKTVNIEEERASRLSTQMTV